MHLESFALIVRDYDDAIQFFVGALGFEGVRMIAIDEDWSALRFRQVDQIGIDLAPTRSDPSGLRLVTDIDTDVVPTP